MKTIWKVLFLILLNIIVSASVTYGVLYYWENIRHSEKDYQLVTVSIPETGDSVPVQEPMPAATESLPAEVSADEEPISEDDSGSAPDPTPVIRGAKVEISFIKDPGVLDSEALRIVSNSDEVLTLQNWTLEDANGHLLTFPNIQLLRKGVFVEVYSRSGHSTPYEIYWNSEEAVWQSGETAVIKDMFGQIQATYRVP